MDTVAQLIIGAFIGASLGADAPWIKEREPGAESLPEPPPFAAIQESCPFCAFRLATVTPRLPSNLYREGRMIRGTSTLFPNLYPYGRYSAVSLFDDRAMSTMVVSAGLATTAGSHFILAAPKRNEAN